MLELYKEIADIWEKNIPGRGKSQCKILERRICLDYSKDKGRPVWLELSNTEESPR